MYWYDILNAETSQVGGNSVKLLEQIKKSPKEKLIVPLLIVYFIILGIADYLVCAVWQFYENL